MQRLLSEALGKEDEPTLLRAQSDTEAYYGRLSRARSFSRRAVDSAFRVGSPETKAREQAHHPALCHPCHPGPNL
jgi:hypothetical protein